MPQLIQLIYCSAAKGSFSRSELTDLLVQARRNNAKCGVTGMLLYSEGSFFQVMEGEPDTVDKLFALIRSDKRHKHVTVIIREPIARRSFGDWTMGYADITPREADSILGTNDFFGKGESFAQLSQGRAKKLLEAFKHGRWRTRLNGAATPAMELPPPAPSSEAAHSSSPAGVPASMPPHLRYSFAFQPIIDVASGTIFSYEALIRGLNDEPAEQVLKRVSPGEMHMFDERSRVQALELAAHLGLSTRLDLNFLPLSVESSPTAISSILDAADRRRVPLDRIVLEILESEIIGDLSRFKAAVDEYRGSGLIFAIDDFGAGYAGLNLLADFQPNIIKLDMHLVRGIARQGPRQAIVRGIMRTCSDLGIDIIAEGVETVDEFKWLQNEGIVLFQGNLFAEPAFEQLPKAFRLQS